MPAAPKLSTSDDPKQARSDALIQTIQQHFKVGRDVRRGVCLLNAGQYDQAADAFRRAQRAGCTDRSLPSYLAACTRAATWAVNVRPTIPRRPLTLSINGGSEVFIGFGVQGLVEPFVELGEG